MAGAGALALAATQGWPLIRFYAGVGALVTLSLTIAAGLLASERVLLGARPRVWAQSAHRTLGVLAVICLAAHVATRLPFAVTTFYLALGPVAGVLMLAVAWTGLVRARFAGSARPGRWRVLHAAGYLCWPVALLHGLHAGRPPAVWVTAGYLLLLALVAAAAAVRLSAERRRRRARTARVVVQARAALDEADERYLVALRGDAR
jgi:DMSO/TMAO reductase YedYZ heme-binding membrane subunit